MIWLQAAVLALAASGQGEPVLLDFTAVWCAPCQQMSPTVDRLAAAGCRVQKLDYDKHRDLADKYGVSQLPCYIVIAGGQEVGRVTGVTSYDRLWELYGRADQAYKQLAAQRAAEPPPAMPIHNAPVGGSPGLGNIPAAGGALVSNTQAAGRQDASDEDLIAASVRIRVHDATGQSCGTGTIVDARNGWALVLTCGHIFRDFDGRGRIEVDLFGEAGPQKVEGSLVSFDDKNDIGLLRVQTAAPVKAMPVAPPSRSIAVGEPVINVGCNNGDPPTARRTQISSINKYLGPPNIQAGGAPVEGRSGGGLFAADGTVIGVCNCADPKDNEGLYAAAELIRAELDRANLSFVYQDPRGVLNAGGGTSNGTGSVMLASAATTRSDASRDPFDSRSVLPAVATSAAGEDPSFAPPAMPQKMTLSEDSANLSDLPKRPLQMTSVHEPPASAPAPALAQPLQPALSRAEVATLEEIVRRQNAGADVVCVIRSRDNPAAERQSVTLGPSAGGSLQKIAAELESGRRQFGAEVVCLISSRENPNTKSEIIVLDQGSAAFIRGLAVAVQ